MEYIPKNIRQIGDREDRIKVYLEDYVSTYLRRVQQLHEESGAAGLLVGSWQQGEEAPPCAFISGAMTVRQASLEGGQVSFSPEAWNEGYESLGTYFSGQELCGFFVCEGSCRRFRRQALFAAVRECFPHQEALLYLLTEEGEEIVYRIRSRGEERLQGYYCYFERNEAMQEYMMDHLPDRRVEWEAPHTNRRQPIEGERFATGQSRQGAEGTLGDPSDPAHRFRQKMVREKKGKDRDRRSDGRGLVALCAVMAAVIVVSGMGLAYRERGGVQIRDLLSRLQIDTSLLAAVSALPEETGEHYVGRENHAGEIGSNELPKETAGGLIVEEIPGNVYPTAGEEETPIETETQPEMTEPSDPETQDVSSPTEEPTFAVGTGVLYTVQAGDSLYSISRRFYGNEEMAEVIRQLNDLEDADLIKIGQELLLP